MRIQAHFKILMAAGLSLFLFNCAAPKERVVPVNLIEVQETSERSGNKDTVEVKFTEEKTLAYIDVIESSPNVRSVSRVTNTR